MHTASLHQVAATRFVPDEDDRYDEFLARVHGYFEAAVAASPYLFLTDAAPGLWDSYLRAAPAPARPWLTCNACKTFVESFGGLVTIDEAGRVYSAMWPTDARVPSSYIGAANVMAASVESSSIVGVFRSSLPVWGTPITRVERTKTPSGVFKHFAVSVPKAIRWSSLVKTAEQEMAEKTQEREMLLRGLADFPIEVVRKALALLTSGQLNRSEKHEGTARWLLELHERRASTRNARENLTWLAVATAPAGFCHVRSGMLGTLLEDVAANLPFPTLKRRYEEKMDPLQYLRPQAAPSDGNVAQAEKIVAAMKGAGALDRRFAKLADVQTLWTPRVTSKAEPAPAGVFGHLARRSTPEPADSGAPPTTMTWVKFSSTVLPIAERIELKVPHGTGPYMAMVTAKNADAPPILQWDREDKRNPVSWYCYHNGSPAEQWGLSGGSWHAVRAIVLQPSMWDAARELAHQGAFACLVLEGARDHGYRVGAGFFVECLRSEYHGVRRTLVAYAKAAIVEGKDEAEVCGLDLRKGANWNTIVRVTSKGIVSSYRLDRWE